MSLFEEAQGFHKQGKFKEAIDAYLAALNDDFDDSRTLFFTGTCLYQMGHHGAAASFLARSLQSKPGDIDALINLGACYRNENNFTAADEIWTIARAIAKERGIKSQESGALTNLAGLRVHRGEYPEALTMFEEALAIDPANDHGVANRAMAHLALGHWTEGWVGYDAHLMLNSRRERRYRDTPMWLGEPGKKVVVYGEQGVGDEIMFGSMVQDLMKVCSSVVFDCHPRLVKTWERSLGIACYGTRKTSDIPWFDAEKPEASVAIGSLGRHFRNSEAAFPGTPFLKADQSTVLGHRAREASRRRRIGISWKGGTKITGSPFRKVSLDELRPLFDAVDADWFSLQYTDGAIEEVGKFEERTSIRLRHYPSFVNPQDLSGLVDFVASLDLVITVPTTVVHIAGALGVPCMVLVPHEAAWRVTGNAAERREKMPWYNSIKLLHKTGSDWAPLIAMVAQSLANDRTATRIAAE